MGKSTEERVDRIEKIFWVVGVVAVIFGVSGGWGYGLLQSAETRLNELGRKVENFQSEIQKTTDKAIDSLNKEEEKSIEHLKERANEQLAFVPKGAVMAFNLRNCPEGWKETEFTKGRFIIGVGEAPGLTPRFLLMTGGEEQHQLTIEEMPKHKHEWKNVRNNRPDDYGFGGSERNVHVDSGYSIKEICQEEGGDKAHNNLPPFVALLFCEKE